MPTDSRGTRPSSGKPVPPGSSGARPGPIVRTGPPRGAEGATRPAAGNRSAADPRSGVNGPPPREARSLEPFLARFETGIERLRIEFERYFNGALRLPPEEMLEDLARELKGLRGLTIRSATDQFRLGTLEARFNSLRELLNRRLRAREEGRGPLHAPHRATTPRPDPLAGFVVVDRIEPVAVEALYRGLAEHGSGTPGVDLDRFTAFLEQQLTAIRARTGCGAVQFRLAREGDKLKLKARPLAAAEPNASGGAP